MGPPSFKLETEKLVYFAGEVVSGVVYVMNDMPRRINGITLRSDGYAHVHFTTTRSRTVQRNGRSETETETVHHNQTEQYFSHLIPLLSIHNADRFSLSAGQHRFNFSFQIPFNAPSSYEGRYGRVRYHIRVNLRRPWKFDFEYKLPFTVNTIADLNYSPETRMPVQWMETKTFGCFCCESGPLTAVINLPKSGFVPGEQVLFHARIDNQSKKKQKGVRVELVEETIFYAQGERAFENRVIACNRKDGDLLGVSEWDNQPVVVVPAVVPSTGLDSCRIISIDYKLKFIVETGAFSTNLTLPIDIKIGNVALRDVAPQPLVGVPTSSLQSYQAHENAAFADASVKVEQTINMDDLPPPSYEECVFDPVNVREESDSQHVNGGTDIFYRPQYAVFRGN